MSNKQAVQRAYTNLVSIYKEIPNEKVIHQKSFWEDANKSLSILSSFLEIDLSEYSLKPTYYEYWGDGVPNSYLKQKLRSAITFLHKFHFNDLDNPFEVKASSQPVVSNNITQTTQVTVNVTTSLMMFVMEELQRDDLEPEEKTFLEKLKLKLKDTTSILQLLSTIFNLAKDSGLTTIKLAELFNKLPL